MSALEEVSLGAWASGGYAAFLLAAAYALDLLARRTAARAQAWRSGSFTYHRDHDAWQCPRDQWLWPSSFDPEERVMRYRAAPSVCNACPVKDDCTTSPHGREISRAVDPWPNSEAERFHRGVACTVAVLAVLWPLAFAATRRSGADVVVLVVVAVAAALAGLPLWSHLRRTPSAFPTTVPVSSTDSPVPVTVGRYASDRRPTRAAGGGR